MGAKCTGIFALFVAVISFFIYQHLFATVPVPKLDVNKYWGPSSRVNRVDSERIVPFKVQYSGEVINDLRRRLAEPLKSPEPLEGVGFRYGFNKHQLEKIVTYWRDDYLPRWEQRQGLLNVWPQYQTEIQGLKIHFIHTKDVTPKGKPVVPILLLHGWPGSVREFYELIPKLIAPQKNVDVSFVVVAPSLPGYGFSEGAAIPGMGPTEMAVILRNLMVKLGYKRFLVQGGDWGSRIGSDLSTLFPENAIGYHSNMCNAAWSTLNILKSTIASFYSSPFIPDEYADFIFPVNKTIVFAIEESGYIHLQATKPDTIGIALTQNPVGLAAYILEKFSTWTNHGNRDLNDGGLAKQYTTDALLDNLMVYQLTNSIGTAVRIYAEFFTSEHRAMKIDLVPTNVPTGCARFKHDLYHHLDWQLTSKYTNLVHSTYHRDGGHFAAFEKPQVLYNDFIEFVRKVKLIS